MTPSAAAAARGVTRLCHFTPSLNLPHILRDGRIRPTEELSDDVRACYNPTDLVRLDGHPDCVCCSIEYPNAHYLARARQSGRLQHFPDWVVLLLAIDLIDRPGVLFSPRNAAAGYGVHLQPGLPGLARCYAAAVAGAGGYTFTRGDRHLPPCTTDEQAEVLIPRAISVTEIGGLAVSTQTQARAELARLRTINVSLGPIPVIIAPTFFDRTALSRSIRGGTRPAEQPWEAS
jgi:hypothetical protein